MRVLDLPGQSNGLRLNWKIGWQYDPTKSALKMEESIAATAPIFTRSPRNTNPSQMLKQSNRKEQAGNQYLVMSYRGHVACQGIFLIFSCAVFRWWSSQRNFISHTLYTFCRPTKLHCLALWKIIKTIFFGRYSFLRKKETNKQTKQKGNKKTSKFSSNLELTRKPIIFREHDLMPHITWWLSQSKHYNCNIQWFSF